MPSMVPRLFEGELARIAAMQFEIAQRGYMDETTRLYDDAKAELLRETLRAMQAAYRDGAKRAW